MELVQSSFDWGPKSRDQAHLHYKVSWEKAKARTFKTGSWEPIWGLCSNSKESACNVGDPGSIPGSGRSPWEGKGNLLHYSCLKHPMDRGACWATVRGVTKTLTQWMTSTYFSLSTSNPLKNLENLRKSGNSRKNRREFWGMVKKGIFPLLKNSEMGFKHALPWPKRKLNPCVLELGARSLQSQALLTNVNGSCCRGPATPQTEEKVLS